MLITVVGMSLMGWQLWVHGIDRPISDDTIRSQQLRLSSTELERLQDQLSAYHRSPSSTETIKGDPLAAKKSTGSVNP